MDDDPYEFLDLAIDGGLQIAKVREKATGRLLQIHAFPLTMRAEFDRFGKELSAIPPHVSRMVGFSQDANGLYIWTEPLPDGVGLQGWLSILRTASGDSESERIYRLALQLRIQRESRRPR